MRILLVHLKDSISKEHIITNVTFIVETFVHSIVMFI